MIILDASFFQRDCREVAPELVGKLLTHHFPSGESVTLRISETEAYGGEDDTACHAIEAGPKRTELLYQTRWNHLYLSLLRHALAPERNHRG